MWISLFGHFPSISMPVDVRDRCERPSGVFLFPFKTGSWRFTDSLPRVFVSLVQQPEAFSSPPPVLRLWAQTHSAGTHLNRLEEVRSSGTGRSCPLLQQQAGSLPGQRVNRSLHILFSSVPAGWNLSDGWMEAAGWAAPRFSSAQKGKTVITVNNKKKRRSNWTDGGW